MPAMDPRQLRLVQDLERTGHTDDPRYMQTLMPMHYEQHILRRPFASWPEPVIRSLNHVNSHIYTMMQGPSELGASGTLEHWDRNADLHRITVPTLVIGARYDTMDPAWMEAMSHRLPHGVYLFCPMGSHLAMYDDQETYFTGLIRFLHTVEEGRAPRA
jgi:proline iminopeptidase